MNTAGKPLQAAAVLSGAALIGWRTAQIAVLALGLGIFAALLCFPEIGRHALWDVLITAAPALLVLAPGLWRNICPLGTVAFLPHHLRRSLKRRLPPSWPGRLSLVGVGLLLVLVPARHVLLDPEPRLTAWLLIALGAVALLAGLVFDSKSGWCNSLCPVLPVEKLYGQRPWLTVPNAHCGECRNCTLPCPDSASESNLNLASARRSRDLGVSLTVGGFPGFVWGWFHVPTYRGEVGMHEVLFAYALPWGMMLLSLGAFALLRRLLGPKKDALLAGIFAAAAVSCYYWYRLPALVGFGLFPRDGLLVDLTHVLPAQSVVFAQIAAAAFFVWWLVFRRRPPAAWSVRPPFSSPESAES